MSVRFEIQTLFDDLPEDAIITSIEPVATDPVMRRIKVDGRTMATIRDTDVQELALESGTPLSPDLRQAIINVISCVKARQTVMSLLSRRAYSSVFLIERLEQRNHEPAVAAQVVQELIDDGWVDDEQLARELIEQLLAKGPAGQPKLAQKLAAQKIPPEIAERLIAEALQDVDMKQEALDLIRAQLKRSSDKTGPAVARKMAGLLARRGVGQETIQEVINELGILDGDDPTYD